MWPFYGFYRFFENNLYLVVHWTLLWWWWTRWRFVKSRTGRNRKQLPQGCSCCKQKCFHFSCVPELLFTRKPQQLEWSVAAEKAALARYKTLISRMKELRWNTPDSTCSSDLFMSHSTVQKHIQKSKWNKSENEDLLNKTLYHDIYSIFPLRLIRRLYNPKQPKCGNLKWKKPQKQISFRWKWLLMKLSTGFIFIQTLNERKVALVM